MAEISINNATGQANFKHCDLLRRAYDGKWIRIATGLELKDRFTDFSLQTRKVYEYKARAISTIGGYTDSDIIACSVTMRDTQILNIADISQCVTFRFNPDKQEAPFRGVHEMQYSGLNAPCVEYDERNYSTVNASFFVEPEDIEKIKKLHREAPIMLYRDNRGRKLYGYFSEAPKFKDAVQGHAEVSFTFSETYFLEGV